MAPFARAWGTDGFQVCCLKSIGGNPFEAELRAAGVRVVNLEARNLRDLAAFHRLVRLLRAERVELVHAHLAYASIWGALACRLAGIPLVATLHVPPSRAPRRSREGLREALLCRLLDRRAAAVVAVSGALREAWLRRGGIDPAKLVVAPNGVEVEAFAAPEPGPEGETRTDAAERPEPGRREVRRELGVEPGAPLVATVSVLREGKGLETLLDAVPAVLARHPRARFLIAGDGPLRAALAERAVRLGLGQAVVWAGFRRDVPALLAASDLFVLPSLADAFPTVLLEAMAAGLAVVSTHTGGIPEIVDEPRTGRLVAPGDAAGLAAAVADLLDRPAERRSLGEAGRRRAQVEFSTVAWAARLARIYAAALAGSPHQVRASRETARARVATPGAAPRIAVVEPAGKGGMIHYAYQLCCAYAALGAEVTLVTGRPYELERLPHPFRVQPVLRLWDAKPAGAPPGPLVRRLRRLARAAVHYREWLRLALHLRRERPDLVQLGDIRFPADLACLWLLRRLGLRLTGVCHNVYPYTTGGRAAGLFRRSALDRFLYRRIYRHFELVLVHFEANRRAFLAAFGLPPGRVLAIPHGNEEIFSALADPAVSPAGLRRELGLGPDERAVLLFGTLSRYKGVDLLLQAFAEVAPRAPDARLVVAGFPAADFDLAAHQDLARRLGIAERVRWFPRYVESGAVAAWMRLAAVAVFPYRTVYQSGALAVAQTFGVPVVASAAGAMPESVEDGASGLLVPPGDAPALAAALARVLTEPGLAGRLGERARRDAAERFAWEGIAGRVLERYRRLLSPAAEPEPAPAARGREVPR